jgi:lantibiotic modifying enzyme
MPGGTWRSGRPAPTSGVGLAFALIDIGKVLDHGVLVEVGLDALRDLSTIGK